MNSLTIFACSMGMTFIQVKIHASSRFFKPYTQAWGLLVVYFHVMVAAFFRFYPWKIFSRCLEMQSKWSAEWCLREADLLGLKYKVRWANLVCERSRSEWCSSSLTIVQRRVGFCKSALIAISPRSHYQFVSFPTGKTEIPVCLLELYTSLLFLTLQFITLC